METETNTYLSNFAQLYAYAESVVQSKTIDTSLIISISIKLVQIVEGFKTMTGYQKQQLVLDCLSKLINEHVQDPEQRVTLEAIIQTCMPTVIDTFVSCLNKLITWKKEIVTKCLSVCK